MKKGLSILLVGVMVTSLFGCSFNEPKEQVKLTIAAAASLENAFEDELIPMFEKEYPNVTIEGVYDSSGKLQLQIEKGLDADVFFSAATTQMDALKDEDLVDADSISNVLENKLVLIKGKDSTTTVTGFDNITYSAFTTPCLTTFDQPKFSIGQEAAQLLLDLLQAEDGSIPETPNVKIIKGKLLVRGSTGIPGEV